MSINKLDRELLLNVLNSLDDLVSIHDANYRIIWANQAFCNFVGTGLNTILGKCCYDVLSCMEHGKETCVHFQVSVGQKVSTIEENLCRSNTPFFVTAFPIHKKGKFLGSIHIARNITEMKELKDYINKRECFYTTIINNLQDIVTIISPEGKIIYESPSVKNVYGYEVNELIGKNIAELVHPDDLPDILNIIARGIKIPGFTARVEYRAKNKSGAYQFFETVGFNALDVPEINGLLLISRDITERKRIEHELEVLNTFNKEIIDNIPVGVIRFDNQYRVVFENKEAEKILGVPAGEKSIMIGKDIREMPEKQRSIVLPLYEKIISGIPVSTVVEYVSVYGKHAVIEFKGIPIYDKEVTGALMILHDITELKRSEMERHRMREELFQLHKIESVGKLAGGIAHDFNNILTVISGNLDFLRNQMKNANKEILEAIEEVRRASDRAASLTSQLLAFSRKQIYRPRVVSLNKIIKDIEKMLVRLIGENIKLTLNLSTDPLMIKADPAQIDQVIINLVTNAKDAMPFGGELIITTKNSTLTEDDKKQYPFIIPGEYVLLSVKDNGVGMTPDVKSRVFEPFFTTKEMGKGTGLGLAVVYGIVKQNSGFIFIDSEEGKGTEVKILLPPTMEKEQDEETTIILPDEPVVPTICILVVEDEDSVRKLIVKSLKHKGYNVLEAKDGVQAINLAEKYSDKIDLLLTDVIMPDMNGSVLANKLMSAGRVKHVLYMSGYTENIIARFGVLNEGIELIQKPFTAEELIKKINTILKTST